MLATATLEPTLSIASRDVVLVCIAPGRGIVTVTTPAGPRGKRKTVDLYQVEETVAIAFVKDLAERLAGRVQITTDGLKAYVGAIASGFGCEVDYAILHKI